MTFDLIYQMLLIEQIRMYTTYVYHRVSVEFTIGFISSISDRQWIGQYNYNLLLVYGT